MTLTALDTASPHDDRADFVRVSLLTALRRDVSALVECDQFDALREVLSLTGFVSNWSEHSNRDIGNAIVALAPHVVDVVDLACVVHTAAFYRAAIHDEDAVDQLAVEALWEAADADAGATLERVGGGILEQFTARMTCGGFRTGGAA